VPLRFEQIDWRSLKEDKKLKLRIGLAVVIIMFFLFFIDMVVSISRTSKFEEKAPPRFAPVIKQKAPKKEPPKKIEKKEHFLIKIKHFNKQAKVAIILDDAGGGIPDYKAIFSVKFPLTIAVIPTLPMSSKIAEQARHAGLEVILHLPMEAYNGALTWKVPGMVKLSDSDEQIKNTVLNDLNSIKIAKGFNNHMGSRATSDERVMKIVFDAIKDKKLFFIDSKTSTRTVGCKLARLEGIKCAENNQFLDGSNDRIEIEMRFAELMAKARRNGYAVGIGHATRPATISVLKELMPIYAKDGVKFVKASEVVD
jgi:uncharacterized protein